MMMAHDSSPLPPPSISDESLDALRRALAEYLRMPHAEGVLRTALRQIAREAHAKSITAEQVLIVLKQLWYCGPELRDLASPDQRVQLLQRVVTMCIREYYET